MRHITKEKGVRWPLCGALAQPGDELVLAALNSDCNDCRGVLGIGPTTQRGCEPRPVPTWEPQPMEGDFTKT